MDAKDRIKEQLNIVDVIGEYVQLKRAGSNYKGLCPFHGEKTPSFMVSDERQIFHCFGCHEGGDVISFIQKAEHLEFIDALKLLADRAGIQLEEFKHDRQHSKKQRLYEVCQTAERFYHSVLRSTPAAREALEYLHTRGVQDTSIDTWKLGYAPDSWDTTMKALMSKKFTDAEILEAGIAIRNEKGRVYDRFRGRVMFPLHDATGKTVGFTSRILPSKDDGKTGKYINTPQTPIYNKSQLLYGLHKAKKAIAREESVILVEGNMDVVMSHQAGVEHVVAASGTALTEQHLATLARLTNNLYLSFDADAAGLAAALRSIQLALQHGFDIHMIVLDEHHDRTDIKDPADAVAVDPAIWKNAIAHAIPLMEHVMRHWEQVHDVQSAQGKAAMVKELLPYVSYMKDSVVVSHWVSKVCQRFDIDEKDLRKRLNAPTPTMRHSSYEHHATPDKNRLERLLETLIALVLRHPQHLGYIVDHLRIDDLRPRHLQELAKQLVLYYNQSGQYTYSDIERILVHEQDQHTLRLISLLYDKEFADFTPEAIEQELVQLVERYTDELHKVHLHDLEQQLADAERRGDREAITQIMQSIALHAELRKKS